MISGGADVTVITEMHNKCNVHESKVAQSCQTLCNPMDGSLAPPMGFSRQEGWSGLPFPSPGDLPTQASNPGLRHCRQIPYLSHQGILKPLPTSLTHPLVCEKIVFHKTGPCCQKGWGPLLRTGWGHLNRLAWVTDCEIAAVSTQGFRISAEFILSALSFGRWRINGCICQCFLLVAVDRHLDLIWMYILIKLAKTQKKGSLRAVLAVVSLDDRLMDSGAQMMALVSSSLSSPLPLVFLLSLSILPAYVHLHSLWLLFSH